MKKISVIIGILLLLLAVEFVSAAPCCSSEPEIEDFPGWFPGGYFIDYDGDCKFETYRGRIGQYDVVNRFLGLWYTCGHDCLDILEARNTPTNEWERGCTLRTLVWAHENLCN